MALCPPALSPVPGQVGPVPPPLSRCPSPRYDSYDSYDSRSSLNDRDMYRPGYDYGEPEPDNDGAYEGPYDNFYGGRRDPYPNRPRENFGQRGQNWGREGRNNRPPGSPYPGRAGGQWNEPAAAMGSRGYGPPGSSRLPSLFSHNILPELGMFQGLRGFPGHGRYGGGMMKQRLRRNWRTWDSDFRVSECADTALLGATKGPGAMAENSGGSGLPRVVSPRQNEVILGRF